MRSLISSGGQAAAVMYAARREEIDYSTTSIAVEGIVSLAHRNKTLEAKLSFRY